MKSPLARDPHKLNATYCNLLPRLRPRTMDPAIILPTEIFHEILAHLNGTDLAHVTEVSTLWNELGNNGGLWHSLCVSRWRGKRYMRRSYAIGIAFCTLSLTIGKRLWGDNPERWHWAYGQAELESQRTSTTEYEVVGSYWKFSVLHPSSPRMSNISSQTA